MKEDFFIRKSKRTGATLKYDINWNLLEVNGIPVEDKKNKIKSEIKSTKKEQSKTNFNSKHYNELADSIEKKENELNNIELDEEEYHKEEYEVNEDLINEFDKDNKFINELEVDIGRLNKYDRPLMEEINDKYHLIYHPENYSNDDQLFAILIKKLNILYEGGVNDKDNK